MLKFRIEALSAMLILFAFLAPPVAGDRCKDCSADICVTVGGNGFRSCQDIDIVQMRCVLYLNGSCIETEEFVIDSFCRPSLGGCTGAR